MSDKARPLVLVICDGWGERKDAFGNAIAAAKTPHLDQLRSQWPHTTLAASGEAVGLPEGQIGNSEVGHLTIGAGRIIRQSLSRQHHEIDTGIFYQNEVLVEAIELALERKSALHIIGLVSPGGVHSHQNGALAIARLADKLGLDDVHIHAFTDGRDRPPASGLEDIEAFEKELADIGTGRIASIVGRYYAMDRDNRWERIQLAYEMLVGEEHPHAPNTLDYIKQRYEAGESDEFLRPIAIADTPEDRTRIEDGDVVVFFNFRPDRARQLSYALVDPGFSGFKRSRVVKNLHFVSFTEYDPDLGVPVVFSKENIKDSLAEVISNHNLRQLHIAETEKYAHVTYYVNGGREEAFPGETRKLVPSPKVAIYNEAPAMSAKAVTDGVITAIESRREHLVIANFANADMVGHTGDFTATVQAIEFLDNCLGQIVKVALEHQSAVLITSDHGNAEYKVDRKSGKPLTAHTTNPVPVLLCGTDTKKLRSGGGLQDIAPTVLATMGLPVPDVMTGRDLALRS